MANQVPQAQWGILMANCLTDSAEHWLFAYMENIRQQYPGSDIIDLEYVDIRDALLDAFATANPNTLEDKINNRKQLIGESCEAYAYDMLNLLSQFDPAMTEEQRLRHLIRNSRPSAIPMLMIQNPRTVQEYIIAARQVENSELLVKHQRDSNVLELVEKGYADQKQLSEKYEKLHDELCQAAQENAEQLTKMLTELQTTPQSVALPPHPQATNQLYTGPAMFGITIRDTPNSSPRANAPV